MNHQNDTFLVPKFHLGMPSRNSISSVRNWKWNFLTMFPNGIWEQEKAEILEQEVVFIFSVTSVVNFSSNPKASLCLHK